MPKLGFLTKVLGDSNEKEVKRASRLVDQILDLEAEM